MASFDRRASNDMASNEPLESAASLTDAGTFSLGFIAEGPSLCSWNDRYFSNRGSVDAFGQDHPEQATDTRGAGLLQPGEHVSGGDFLHRRANFLCCLPAVFTANRTS